MYALPTLKVHGGSIILPLTPGGATLLTSWLLGQFDRQRDARRLALDAPLVTWLVLRLGRQIPVSLDELISGLSLSSATVARWLSDRTVTSDLLPEKGHPHLVLPWQQADGLAPWESASASALRQIIDRYEIDFHGGACNGVTCDGDTCHTTEFQRQPEVVRLLCSAVESVLADSTSRADIPADTILFPSAASPARGERDRTCLPGPERERSKDRDSQITLELPAEFRQHWSGSDDACRWLDHLVDTVRQASAREDKFESSLEQAKLAAMKQLAYGASHEINNPLANISSRAQTLLRDERDPRRQRALAAINRQAFRAHEMIADLMLFAHPPKMEKEQVDVNALLHEVDAMVMPMADAQSTQFVVATLEPPPLICVDPTQWVIAILALVRNSLESLGQGGHVHLEAKMDDTQRVCFLVTDDGPGIPADIHPHLFDPFFSGREAGRGLGFGLSKAWRIAQLHGGRVGVRETTHDRTVFFLEIAAVDAGCA